MKHKIVADGNTTIFLSTSGTNKEDVPRELVKFLEYVKADLKESTEDFEDEFVKSLQSSVASVKKSRDMEERFMLLELMLKDEYREGKAESKAEDIIDFLNEIAPVPEVLQETIMNEKNLDTLKRWLKLAVKSTSIEEFSKNM